MTQINDPWPEIIATALEQGLKTSKGPVPGAKLRELVARFAPKYGEIYPPAGHEDEKFAQFLKQFNSTVILLFREGQDILVAPAARPELLVGTEDDRQATLRDDIFEAFTRISHEDPPKEPWYSRREDTIRWSASTEPLDPIEFAKIPPPTRFQEVEDRRDFANTAEMERHKDALLATLGQHSALFAFSQTVKEYGLARKWHLFRFQAIVKRIRSWCENEGVEWRDEWIGVKTDKSVPLSLTDLSINIARKPAGLAKFIERLSEDDLKRVSVPLDIVLKLLQ